MSCVNLNINIFMLTNTSKHSVAVEGSSTIFCILDSGYEPRIHELSLSNIVKQRSKGPNRH